MSKEKTTLDKVKDLRGRIKKVRDVHQRIGRELQELIEETEKLISELDISQEEGQINVTERQVSLESYRNLIHRRVRIINPPKGDLGYGIVKGVGTYFVKVILDSNGNTINRAAKNVRLIERS